MITQSLINGIRLAFKRANQRIVELGKQFGKGSKILKNETAWMEKGAVDKYTGLSASGNKKFDISKIVEDFRSGKLSEDEINDFLQKSSGLTISEDDLVETGKGISTKTDIKERAMSSMGADEENWKDVAEDMAEIEESFQTEYEEVKHSRPKKQTLKQRKKEEKAMPTLYSKNKSYSDMKKAIEEMKQFRMKGKAINEKLK